MTGRDKNERRETVLLALGCFVVAAEVVAVLIQVAFPKHVVPTEFHAIAFMVGTALFGTAALAGRRSEKQDA